jgi:hypothetical protein
MHQRGWQPLKRTSLRRFLARWFRATLNPGVQVILPNQHTRAPILVVIGPALLASTRSKVRSETRARWEASLLVSRV